MQEQRFQGYELSPQQKHLWLLQQSFDDLSYNCRCIVLIEGKLDSGLLEAALKSLVARHEILRTGFLSFSGMVLPLQVIGDGNAAMLKVDDISGLDAQAQWARIDSRFEQLGCEPVDFQNALPLKTTLMILSPIQHALLISLPAICSDSKGLDHLVAELAYAYRAGIDGECFTSEPVQYADVSSVLNQLIESEEMESGRAYWGEKNLQRLIDSKLPLENSRSQNSTFAFQSIQSTVASSLVTKIESLAELCNTEPAIFLLACWQMLLWRLTSQTEVTVSVAYDGRTEEELADALGLFTRYLPVECRLQEQLTFKEALKLMADEVCETGRWQDYFS